VDTGALNLFYIQACYNVVQSNYPCDVDMAVKLGGIQLQITVGDYNNAVHKYGYLTESLHKFVPEHLATSLKLQDWEEKLFASHSLHKGKDQNSLRLLYLELVRQWPYYGSTFFKAKYVQNDTFFQQEFEGPVRIGINENGVHLISPKEMKIITYAFSELAVWDSVKGIFAFEVKESSSGGLFKLKKKPNKNYQFKSDQADLINDLLCDWSNEVQPVKDEQRQRSASRKVPLE